jgi:hypothetical protein
MKGFMSEAGVLVAGRQSINNGPKKALMSEAYLSIRLNFECRTKDSHTSRTF